MGRTLDMIKLAIDKGYTINDKGEVFSPYGKELKIGLHGNQRYPTFSINYGGGIYGIPVHQFAAYLFYGDRPDGLVIRHLDGNAENNSKNNLIYGTHSENNLDKSEQTRRDVAIKARAARDEEDFYKLDTNQREFIGLIYNAFGNKTPNGLTSWLGRMFDVDRNTISRAGRKHRQLLGATS